MQQPSRQDTKAALISAAERLIAEKGLGSVSVRDITRAAGARNESALHYHFGDMQSLIRQIFIDRFREIEQSRLEKISQFDSEGRGKDISALMEAALGPLMEACLDPGGRLYARFSIQLAFDPRVDIVELVRDTGMQSVTIIRDRVQEKLKDLPPQLLASRLRRLFLISLVLTADYAHLVETGTAPPFKEATREAAACLTGFLLAQTIDTPC
ncbi:MAG: helix-turn-helix domain-containing protein [Hyphomonas sp.]|uniref:TetR/AcrR family transcriptional regulator n=1 Tax=Hyphomonas sp. TaxID=87 RepID=UPI0035276072